MRLKHLVVASLLAGALAVAGATTLAQPRPEECDECIDAFDAAMELCNGRDRRECRTRAFAELQVCLANAPDACSSPRKGRR